LVSGEWLSVSGRCYDLLGVRTDVNFDGASDEYFGVADVDSDRVDYSGRRAWLGSLLPAPLERPGVGEDRVENGLIGECKDVVFGNDVESHRVPKQIRKPSRESE